MTTRSRRLRDLALLLAIGLCPTAWAQEGPEPRESDTVEDYVVVVGDTLSDITEKILGSSHLWRENWRLNPQVRDPDLLRIGQRLRIITHRELPPRTAEVREVHRTVQRRPPEDWVASYEGDFLKKDQSLRTRAKSSASVRFDDDTILTLKEDTLVVFREMGESLRGVRSETIAIDQGTADLVAAPRRKGSSEIKILVGDATTEMRTGRTGRNASRLSRSADDSSSAVMIYEGDSTVSSGGSSIEVGPGMGTRVADGQPPTPAERLLPRPGVRAPRSRQSFGYSNPLFRWDPVDGASAYSIEICDSPECTRILDRGTGLSSTEYRPEGVPAGAAYWRVRAVSATGLDGFPSRMSSLSITDPTPDLAAPAVEVEIAERGRWVAEDHAALAADGSLRVTLTDDQSGVDDAEYRWDEGRWRSLPETGLSMPSAADHTLEVRATDRAGRSVTHRVRVDHLGPPTPPTLQIRGRQATPSTEPPAAPPAIPGERP